MEIYRMNYLSFKEQLKDFISFSLADVRKIDAGFDLRRLSEWQEKGYIKMIRRGHYVFSDLQVNETVLFLMANKTYAPSYVSMEMALFYYNFIPESVYGVTSASSRKTNRFVTSFGEFIYHHIKPQLMFGYHLVSYRGLNFKIAEPEKAILDYFYLNAHLNTEDDFAGLRINGEEFKEQTNTDKLERYLAAFGNKRLEKRLTNFLTYINHD
jgi:predicted transcriptional regulator of viral defense system